MTSSLKFVAIFAAGLIVGALAFVVLGFDQAHAREETKMAFHNRELAIEKGDRAMQSYFEEVITWNACRHLDPRFVQGSYKMDWLSAEVEEPPYRRIKDGISYSELRKLMRERGNSSN